MLQYVRNTSVIGRVGLEPDGEDVVLVVSCDMEMLRASLIMLEQQRCKLQFRNMLGALQGEAVQLLSGLGVVAQARGGSISSRRCRWPTLGILFEIT